MQGSAMSPAATSTLCTGMPMAMWRVLPALADELVRLKPDVMVASNTQAAIAMRQATAAIPIVAANVTDPVGFGLVASHARPGGNVTGILASLDTLPGSSSRLPPKLFGARSKWACCSMPAFSRTRSIRKGAEVAAAALAIKLVPVEVGTPDDLDAAFQSMARERVDGVLVLQDRCSSPSADELPCWRSRAAADHVRLPRACRSRRPDEYGVDLRANFRRAADFVDKILKGAKPADCRWNCRPSSNWSSISRPRKRSASTIPETFLARADEVIE